MGGRLVAHFGLGSLRSHLRVTVFLRALIPSQHPIALPLAATKRSPASWYAFISGAISSNVR